MIVTVLCQYDYAGMAERLARILRTSGVDAIAIAEKAHSVYNIELAKSINKLGGVYVKARLRKSNIIHFMTDTLYTTKWGGFDIRGKKRVYTFIGSVFRRGREECVSLARYPVNAYKADYLSAGSPELCYNKNIHLMEAAWDNFDYKYTKRDFTVSHIPSSPITKGSDIINQGMQMAGVTAVYVAKVPNNQALEIKGRSSIYIDQMLLPVYGHAAIEAMSMGVPVINWDEGLYPYETPIIKPKTKTAESVSEAIKQNMEWERLEELSVKTFEYVKRVHGGMGKRWIEIYKNL